MRARCNLCPNRPEALTPPDGEGIEIDRGEGVVLINDDASIDYGYMNTTRRGIEMSHGYWSSDELTKGNPSLASGIANCPGSSAQQITTRTGSIFRKNTTSWEIVCTPLYEALGGLPTAASVKELFKD